MIAARYTGVINRELLTPPAGVPGTTPVMHLYVVECLKGREKVAAHLREAGIATAIHYPLPVHRQPAYQGRCRGCENLPVTESLVARILSLPLNPGLTPEQVDRICSSLKFSSLS